MGRKWVKTRFTKSVLGPLGFLKQVFFAHLESVVTRYGTFNIPECLGNGSFWYQKSPKIGQNRSKTRFSKAVPGPFEVHKQVK